MNATTQAAEKRTHEAHPLQIEALTFLPSKSVSAFRVYAVYNSVKGSCSEPVGFTTHSCAPECPFPPKPSHRTKNSLTLQWKVSGIKHPPPQQKKMCSPVESCISQSRKRREVVKGPGSSASYPLGTSQSCIAAVQSTIQQTRAALHSCSLLIFLGEEKEAPGGQSETCSFLFNASLRMLKCIAGGSWYV